MGERGEEGRRRGRVSKGGGERETESKVSNGEKWGGIMEESFVRVSNLKSECNLFSPSFKCCLRI